MEVGESKQFPLPMSSKGPSEVLRRHNEIRSALAFFLQQWGKHKQASTVADPQAVLRDFVRFRSLESVIERIKSSHPSVQLPSERRSGGRR